MSQEKKWPEFYKINGRSITSIDTIYISIPIHEIDNIPNLRVITIKDGVNKPTNEQLIYYLKVHGKKLKKKDGAFRIFVMEHVSGQRFIARQRHRKNGIVLEFQGLQQYKKDARLTEGTCLRRKMALEVMQYLKDFRINRIDVAIDLPSITKAIIKHILDQGRKAVSFDTTVYFQPEKQREKENARLKITMYDKSKKNELPWPVQRLEFTLKSSCWPRNPMPYISFDAIVQHRFKKVFKRWAGIDVEVLDLTCMHDYYDAYAFARAQVLMLHKFSPIDL